MAVWTAPTTRSTGALVSASIWNTDIVENLKYLKDSPVFDGDVSVGDDLLLTSTGAVINFASGDVTITHSTNTLTFAGASSGYVFNDGVLTVSGFGTHTFSASGTGANRIQLTNPTAGTGNNVLFRGDTDIAEAVYMRGTSSTYTAAGTIPQAGADFGSSGSGGVSISAQHASGAIRFYSGGTTERMRLTSGGDLAIGATAKLYLDGTAGTGDTYIHEQSANQIEVITNGSRAFMANASFVELGTRDFVVQATKRLYLDGGGDTYITESSGNAMEFLVGGTRHLRLNNGYFEAKPVYDQTSGSAANVVVVSDGTMYRSTSSLRWKHDVYTLDTAEALAAVMAMRPAIYRGKTDKDQRRFVGFIAEEMAQIAPLLCTYDEGGESGTPNYVTYDRVTAYLVAVVQQQQARIDALEARIH